MLTVIDRMVSLELLKTLVSILLVLVIIIVSRKFLGILTKAIEGEVATDTVFTLLGLKSLTALAVLIPPSLFMAVLTVMGRMYRDHEMSVLASAGVGAKRLYRSLIWVVIPVFFLSAYMALVLMPWSERQSQERIKHDVETQDIRGIKAGRFNEFSSGDVVLYAESMDEHNDMLNIFVQSRQNNKTGVVVAEKGRLHKAENGDNFVILNEGRRFQGTPGQADYIISEFDEYAVRISGPEEMSATLRREGTDSLTLFLSRTPKDLAELQKRVAIPLGVLALALLALPLARVSPRQGPYGNVFSAFIIYILYENSQKISQGMLMSEKIPAWASYTVIYGVLLLMTAFLFLKNLGPRWIRHTLRIGRQT
ncbi:MAG: LPS export ABC transporter permease LptF [Methylococcaceae bacterium]|jgi:lipopolysaccharide export system permease protein|nr:LPS export ABC transporter permease LptF [Methylococcaceae bacterium]